MNLIACVKKFFRGVLFGVPATVTLIDSFGYIAKVDGVSMQPSLNPDFNDGGSDFVLLNQWSVRKFDFKHGDIVALISPRNPSQRIIKRVIALEGETIKALGPEQQYVTIPKGHCWVEGDNHKHSMDSNFFGPVATGLITAKASHIVWPPQRWQRLKSYLPCEHYYRK